MVVSDVMTLINLPNNLDQADPKVIPKNVASAVFASFILMDAGLSEATKVTSPTTETTSPTSQLTAGDDVDKKRTEEFDLVCDLFYTTAFARCLLGKRKEVSCI